MTNETPQRPWEVLEQVAELGDADRLEQFIESLPPGEAARALDRCSSEDQNRVLTTLAPEDAANLIGEIPEVQAVELLEHLPSLDAAAILNEMPSAAQADFIGALDAENAGAVLAAMDPEEASDARRLADYPGGVAGGLMVSEYLAYRDTALVGDLIDDLRRNAERYAKYDIQYIYVISDAGVLVGVLRLRDLLLAPSARPVAAMMLRPPLRVHDGDGLDDLGDFFERHMFLGVPVVDQTGRLIGIVRRGDVQTALGRRSDNDYLKSQGVVGGEELRSMPLFRRSSRRLSWLSINIVLNVVAASVIALYQDTLASVIALAVFLPIISDMSGCSGAQAVAVSIRELTLGLVKPFELVHVLGKELAVGIVNGIALGLLIALVAFLWKGNPYLGLVVGGAMSVNTIVAVAIGGMVPLVLKRFGFDPALASGPILTTITDVCGFFLLLSLATLLLPHLQAGT